MIPEQIVDETWQEVADWPEEKATEELVALTSRQPYLTAFVTAHAEDMAEDGAELAVYLFFNVVRMFEKGAGELKPIPGEAIDRRFEANQKLLSGLTEAHPKFFEQVARASSERQPHVMGYVVEAILEEPEDEPLDIEEDEYGTIFLLLLTVVDVLDERAGKKKTSRTSSIEH
jgi:hypothetical protein